MKHVTRVCIIVVGVAFVSDVALAQRRQRGSVRYSRPDGTYDRSTRGGGNIQSTQTTQGDRRTTESTVTGRGGETVKSTREVTREDDTLTVQGKAQSSTGASREASREIEVEDGRIERAERESQTTGRYGETIEREAQVEREAYGVASFEREARTSTGREAGVEGVAGYGAYGRRGVVADVDTKYYGDWTTAARRGPYGAAVTRLPQGYRPYNYHGRSYYYHGSVYYRPYAWRGTSYYFVVPPPYGVFYTTVPPGAIVITMGAMTYYYADQVCYTKTSSQGQSGYQVVPPPAGLSTAELPLEKATVTVGAATYAYYKNTFYRQTLKDGQRQWVVVTKPQGVVTLEALPPEFEIVQAASGAAYFTYEGTYYLPYLDPEGRELYVVVDPPPTEAPAVAPEGTAMAERNLTVPAGTVLAVRTSSELSSAANQTGERFSGHLDHDVMVGEMLAAPKGTRVYGLIASVEQAGSMSGQSKMTLRLTDIEVNGRVVPLSASDYAVEGAASSQDTGRKIAGGAGLGTLIGAIADGGSGAWKGAIIGAGVGTAAAAATKGDAVSVASQTPISFTLVQPLTVPIAVRVASSEP